MSSAPPTKAAELTRQQKIDRYGYLDLAIQRFAPNVEEHAALKEEIRSWYPDEPEKSFLAVGSKFTLQLGAAEQRREITDHKKAFTLLRGAVGSLDGAIALLTIPLGAAIDKFIPEIKHRQFLSKARTGPRPVKAVPNA